jgi:hypothetical protein
MTNQNNRGGHLELDPYESNFALALERKLEGCLYITGKMTGGTNKYVFKVGYKDEDRVLNVILNKDNNKGHGIDPARGLKIVNLIKLLGDIQRGDFDKINYIGNLPINKKEQLDLKKIIEELSKEDLKKFQNFSITKVFHTGIINADSRSADYSDNAFYIVEKIDKLENTQNKEKSENPGNYYKNRIKEVESEAVAFTSLSIFLNKIIGRDLIKAFLDEHDPYSPSDMLRKLSDITIDKDREIPEAIKNKEWVSEREQEILSNLTEFFSNITGLKIEQPAHANEELIRAIMAPEGEISYWNMKAKVGIGKLITTGEVQLNEALYSKTVNRVKSYIKTSFKGEEGLDKKLFNRFSIDELRKEIFDTYSKEELEEIGASYISTLIKQVEKLDEQYEKMYETCSKGYVHGDPWYDNLIKDKNGKLFVIDIEESGFGIHIMDAAIQIISKEGINFDHKTEIDKTDKTSILNEVGKKIIDVYKGQGLIDEKDIQYLPEALTLASKYIEVMRVYKWAEEIYNKRSPLVEGINAQHSSKVGNVFNDKNLPDSYFTLSEVQGGLEKYEGAFKR